MPGNKSCFGFAFYMLRLKNIIAWLLLATFLCSWQPLFSNQSGEGLQLPEVVVLGEDRARLEGFRDFGLLPALAPGIKLEPVADNLTLDARTGQSGPEWETAAAQAPGCAYRNPLTASLARGFNGAEGYYRSGRQKYIEGLLGEAEAYFTAGLEKFKDSELVPDFHYWLAEIAFRQENYQVARNHFAVVAGAETNLFYHYACYSLAWLDYRDKAYPAAVKWFAVASLSPDRRLAAAALFWQGEALLDAGQLDAGRLVLLRLTVAYPAAAEYRAALYRLATISFNERDYQTAFNYLAALPAAAAGAGEGDMLQRQADLARGWCLYFLRASSEAEALFSTLQQESAGFDDVIPLAFLGEILSLLKQQKITAAEDLFAGRRSELSRAAVAAAALRELAAAYTEAGDYTAAVRCGQLLLSSFPAALVEVDDYRRLARLQVKLEQNDKALATLAQGIEGAAGVSGAPLLQLERARILLSAGEAKAAADLLQGLFAEKDKFKEAADRTQLYLLLARSLNRQGKFAQTLAVLAAGPDDCAPAERADLLYERGWAALKNSAYAGAAADFSAYLEIAGKSGKPLLMIQNAAINRAEALFNQHLDQEAAEALRQFVERYPQSPFLARAQNYRGLLALRQGEFEKAATILAHLLPAAAGTDPALVAEILFNLGESYFSLGNYAQAIKTYQQLTAQYPGAEISGRALIRVGESYFNQGDYLKAQLVYLQAKQAFPGGSIDEKASYGMLLLAYNQDKFAYLEIEVKNFIARFPESSYTVPLLLLLADLYQRQGRQADLLSLFRQLEEGDYAGDLQLEAYYRHFKLDLDGGRQQMARDDCLALLQRFPASKYECDCRLFLARYAFAGKDFSAAETALAGMPEACPDPDLRREVTLLKAQICQQLGDSGKARSYFLAVIEEQRRDNSDFAACSGLGALLAQRREFDEALFFYDKAVADPRPAEAAAASLQRAGVLERAGRRREALQAYLRLSYLFPGQEEPVVEALLAAVRLARNEKDGATVKKITEKLKTMKLSGAQEKEFKKLVD
ncbi:MAG: tetratricopeptide repeat protein [Deltaproteobacteria bacterium]|nr:tetratricopeptide repeat protein [Deltaproteobacteria bacterium]